MALVKLEKTLAPVVSPSGRPLWIAQIAPLYESVLPRLYGGQRNVDCRIAGGKQADLMSPASELFNQIGDNTFR